ncbi:MAG TPA: pectin esterase [Candidatus Tetragenococcus pullicola]|nr:pectin esterase [Candidatus Tetragenococcus pullicola]
METIFGETFMKPILVSKNKSSAFQSIQAAINEAASLKNHQIEIEAGTYFENLKIYQDDLVIKGNGKVIINGNLSARKLGENGKQRGTFQTATVFMNGKGNCLENLTIKNTAGDGDKVGQAVALYLEGVANTIHNCRIDSFQDTICLGPLPETNKDGSTMESPWVKRIFESQSAYFSQCQIQGTVDFIFGGAYTVFNKCHLHAKKRSKPNYLTAASTPEGRRGFIFEKCQITGESPYYLGRPWRPFAKTCFKDCKFDSQLLKTGWHDWNKPENQETVCYEEINCHYQGKIKRAKWLIQKGGTFHA